LNRIIDKFLETLKIDSAESKSFGTTNGYPSISARALTKDGRNLHMKSIIKGAYYYLLLSVETDEQPNKKFFDSFKFTDHVYLFESEVVYDSIMRFEVQSNHLDPDPYVQQIFRARDAKSDKKVEDELDKSYNQDRNTSYYSENYEEVFVQMDVYSPYYQIKDMKERWDDIIERHAKNDFLYPFFEQREQKDGVHTMEVSFADSSSSRIIHKKFILNLNRMYILSANLDTVSQKSPFIANFFNSFKPVNEDSSAVSVFDDKAKMFFENIRNEDSLVRDAALKAVNQHVIFDEKHVPQMIDAIKNYSFTTEYIDAKITLIKDLGNIKHPDVLPFLESYYLQSSDTSSYQVAVLNALARQKTKKATQLFIKLLDKDIPVVNDNYAIANMLRPYRDSLQLTNYLFPDLLNYTFVNKDYEDEINSLLSSAVTKDVLNPKKYKKYTNDMLKKAKILVKGERSALQNDKKYKGSNWALRRFANLLFPFQRNKKIKSFLDDLMQLNKNFQASLIPMMLRNNVKLTPEFWASMQEDITSYSDFASRIEFLDDKLKKDIPKNLIDQEKLCRSSLFFQNSWNSYDEKKDSIVFLQREFVQTRRDKGWVYFYKTKREKADLWTLAYIGIQPEDESEFKTSLTQTKTRISIPRGVDMDELIKDQIKSIELGDRPRASENNYDGYNFDFW